MNELVAAVKRMERNFVIVDRNEVRHPVNIELLAAWAPSFKKSINTSIRQYILSVASTEMVQHFIHYIETWEILDNYDPGVPYDNLFMFADVLSQWGLTTYAAWVLGQIKPMLRGEDMVRVLIIADQRGDYELVKEGVRMIMTAMDTPYCQSEKSCVHCCFHGQKSHKCCVHMRNVRELVAHRTPEQAQHLLRILVREMSPTQSLNLLEDLFRKISIS